MQWGGIMSMHSRSHQLGLAVLLPSFALLAGCMGTLADEEAQSRYVADGGTLADGAPIPPGTSAAVGVPCDVSKALAGCVSCHASTPVGGAPMALVSYADLTAPSAADPASTNVQRSVVRMMDTKSPMPPSPAAHATAADIATLTSWIAAGTPTGTCGGGGADGGLAPAPTPTTGGDAATAAATGVPCDVATAFASCASCHSSTPSGGAPMALVSYSDLTAISAKDPTMTNAQRSVLRMKATTSPMPPAPGTPATAATIATIQAWITAGTPKGTCGGGDAGPVVPSPFSGPSVCTSGKSWTGGDKGSSSMHPGVACIACHSKSSEPPQFAAAGTVYPTGHEPDNCNSVLAAPATVVIVDATKKVFNLTVNSVGNFSVPGTIAKPYTAKIVYEGRERIMTASQTNGDCNSCHTQAGASLAPGRLLLP
jgi:hypothetical protein